MTLPDLAPTILQALGVAVPDAMTGTAINAVDGRASDPGATATRDARSVFRERTVGPVTGAFFGLVGVALGAAVLGFRRRAARPWWRIGLLAVIAFPGLTFLSGLVAYERAGLGGYVAALLVGSVVVALVVTPARRLTPLGPALLLLGATWLMLVGDVLTDGRLQFDTPFGYSPITAARFAGMGNLGFALLAATAIIGTCGLWPTWPGVGLEPVPRPDRAPAGLLLLAAVVFLVSLGADGVPAWGADVGGVLALVPALAVTWLLLAGRRVGGRRVVALVGVAVVAVVALAFVDLARPASQRTHLGRFAQRVVDGDAWLILRRKAASNLHVLLNPGVILAVVVIAVAVVVAWRRSRPFAEARRRVPGVWAIVAGGTLAAVFGFGVNDSGIAVPGMMLALAGPWFILVCDTLPSSDAARPDDADAGTSAPVARPGRPVTSP